MNREDRERLAELSRLSSDVVPLAMKSMEESGWFQVVSTSDTSPA
jgi:hypothetical protein